MDIRAKIAAAVESRRSAIVGLSRDIHADPELAFEEADRKSVV